jgi:hypothetical protein
MPGPPNAWDAHQKLYILVICVAVSHLGIDQFAPLLVVYVLVKEL